MTDFIQITDDAIEPGFCDHLMGVFDRSPHLEKGKTAGGVDLAVKNSTDLHLNEHAEYRGELQYLTRATTRHLERYLEAHLFLLLGTFHLTVEHPETGEPVNLTQDNFAEIGRPQFPAMMGQLLRIAPIQAQRYRKGVGGYPYWHSETSPEMRHNESLHRVLLFMFYLNDVEEGGETEFFYQSRKVAPKRGRMVIAPAYFTHTHRGNTPISGDKYIVTSWILFQRAEKIYGQPPGG